MNNATFRINEVIAFLEDNKKPFAAKCLQSLNLERITNQELQIWFQQHFGREQAYKLFRAMECVVTQSFSLENA
jgi:hypothetical protein